MRPTPSLPSWIRDFRTPAYTNIYELCPGETRLFGTESLFGDWDAEVLLLAKDFAPHRLVDRRLAEGDPRPFRHEPAMLTNKNLVRFASPIGRPLLYGSALAGLLRNDGRVSGALPDRTAITPHVTGVLRFTAASMPRLRAIASLGQDAWRFCAKAFGGPSIAWAVARKAREPVVRGGVPVFAMAHPSRHPGGKAAVLADWELLNRYLQSVNRLAA